METVSFQMENLCVPCHCRCRHCLLAYDGHTIGAEYEQGKALARRIAAESPVMFGYYIGYCMDTPMLFDHIAFCREIGSPAGRFLQMNGFRERPDRDIRDLMEQIKHVGVELIDLTFYGLPEYHDAFAGRRGDFRLLTAMLATANKAGLPVFISAPITEENAGQAERLLDLLAAYKTEDIRFYLPHAKGRGRFLEEKRLRSATLDRLPPAVRARMPRVKTQSEAQWLAESAFPEPETRTLTLSLTPDTLARCAPMSAADMIAELEALDDAFYAAIPPSAELARLYGDPSGGKLFRYRDLVLLWTKKYVLDNHIQLHDITDERGHFSVRQ